MDQVTWSAVAGTVFVAYQSTLLLTGGSTGHILCFYAGTISNVDRRLLLDLAAGQYPGRGADGLVQQPDHHGTHVLRLLPGWSCDAGA